MSVLPVSDEMALRAAHGALEGRYRDVVERADDLQTALTSDLTAENVPVSDKLALMERELQELQDALNDMHGVIKTPDELSLYLERLQVCSSNKTFPRSKNPLNLSRWLRY